MTAGQNAVALAKIAAGKGRVCVVCKEYKDTENFSPNPKGLVGLNSKCTPCVNKYLQDKRNEEFVKRDKFTVTDERVIDYDSPTGKAYIGFNKKPFMKVEDGYGYRGVLMQTDNRELVQCHICGEWLRTLGKHVKSAHDISSKDYREKFGFTSKHALVSDAVSYQKEMTMRKEWEKNGGPFWDKPGVGSRGSGKDKGAGKMSRKNATGTCDLQLKFKVWEYLKKYRMLPAQTKKYESRKLCNQLYRRWGSMGDAFRAAGLPTVSRGGKYVKLTAESGETLSFTYDEYQRDDIYQWILDHSKEPDWGEV